MATIPPLIRRVPKAFVRFATAHNELARACRPVLNLAGGPGIIITKAEGNIVIATPQQNTSPSPP